MIRSRFAWKPILPLFALGFLLLSGLAQASSLPEFTDLAEKAGKAVVNINTVKIVDNNEAFKQFQRFHGPNSNNPLDEFFDRFFGGRAPEQKQRSLGSGFLISNDGFIVTNNHVVEGADEIKVSLQDGGESYDAKVIGRDPETDLALLKIDNGDDLPHLKFGDSDDIKVGSWVVAIGNPFGLGHTVTAGIISAKGRVIGSGAFDDYLQTDASINPGNSGGPLLNLDGEVVGINTAIVPAGQGIGFAVPASMAKEIINELKSGGAVHRGWLGVSIQDVDDQTAKALGLDEPKGALIANVMPGEPAANAGVRTGDVVLEVNDKPMADSQQLLRTVAGLEPGDKASLTLWRGGKVRKVTVELGERGPERIAGLGGQNGQDEGAAEVSLGLSVRPLTSEEARALDMDPSKGLLVESVKPNSPADEAGVQAGDVILEANQHNVNSVNDLSQVIKEDGKDKGVVMLLLKRRGQNLFRTIPVEE